MKIEHKGAGSQLPKGFSSSVKLLADNREKGQRKDQKEKEDG
jgi:hypothetical protein